MKSATSQECHPPSTGAPAADELILLVHGVGDPQPGETLSLFARSLAEQQSPLAEHQEVVWLQEPVDGDRDVKTFATHVRSLQLNGRRTVLAEVFWGDLSQVRRGTLGALLGLLQIFFGLRYVAYVASDQPGWASRALQKCGLLCSRILHGPVLAVNVLLGLLTLAAALTEVLWPESSTRDLWTGFLVAACALVGISTSSIARRFAHTQVGRRFWFWVAIGSIFLVMLLVFDSSISQSKNLPVHGLLWYCRVYISLLSALWLALVAVQTGLFASWALACFGRRSYRPALHVALVLPNVMIAAWGLVLPIVWLTGSRVLSQVQLQQFNLLFQNAVPLLGVLCLMTAFLMAVFLLCLARYGLWRESVSVHRFEQGRRPPRLLVNGWIQVATAMCALTGIGLATYLAAVDIRGIPIRDLRLASWIAEANKYAIIALVPLGGMVLLSLRYLRPALDIVMDVVNHFYFRQVASGRPATEDEFDVELHGAGNDSYSFSRRNAIHHRMKQVLTHFRRSLSAKTSLTIVSHSQGTVISVEVLNDPELDWLASRFRRIHLLTMGSPLSHIYQHYFRHLYPPLQSGFWSRLRTRLDRWTNVFRIDDFVGTEIEFPSAEANWRPVCSNHPVAQKGHNLYWRDRHVLAIVKQLVLSDSLTTDTSGGSRPAVGGKAA